MSFLVLGLSVLAVTNCSAQNTVSTNYENEAVKSQNVKNEAPDAKRRTVATDGSKTAELCYCNGRRHCEFLVWAGN